MDSNEAHELWGIIYWWWWPPMAMSGRTINFPAALHDLCSKLVVGVTGRCRYRQQRGAH
jgi:hypothetical protein